MSTITLTISQESAATTQASSSTAVSSIADAVDSIIQKLQQTNLLSENEWAQITSHPFLSLFLDISTDAAAHEAAQALAVLQTQMVQPKLQAGLDLGKQRLLLDCIKEIKALPVPVALYIPHCKEAMRIKKKAEKVQRLCQSELAAIQQGAVLRAETSSQLLDSLREKHAALSASYQASTTEKQQSIQHLMQKAEEGLQQGKSTLKKCSEANEKGKEQVQKVITVLTHGQQVT